VAEPRGWEGYDDVGEVIVGLEEAVAGADKTTAMRAAACERIQADRLVAGDLSGARLPHQPTYAGALVFGPTKVAKRIKRERAVGDTHP
jgi:hypothetical protein